MKRMLLLLAVAALSGCDGQQPDIRTTATCEPMSESVDDAPLEEMPDDDQGIIYF